MFKTSKNHIVPVLHKLCNKILILGNFPRNWQISTLTPIHKKGPKDCTTNYRGIAVSNSLCKIFCSILNNRLVKYLEKHNIIPENQIGFRHSHRTADHVLTLKTIIDKYFQSKKYVYCCFIDLKSAFDTVWRTAIFYKLLKLGIGGNFLNILIDMYSSVKFCMKIDKISDTFSSSMGVKQGCVLSPTLFNIYLHDIPNIFSPNCNPVKIKEIYHHLCMPMT